MPGPTSMIRTAAAALLAGLAMGCGWTEPPPGDVAARWIDDDPETLLTISDLVCEQAAAGIGPTDPTAAKRWRTHHLDVVGPRDGMLEVVQNGADPWLATDVDLDAGSIGTVEVEIVNPGPAAVQLFWKGEWQRFSMQRMARPTERRRLADGTLVCRFDVGDHPSWRGRVRSLRVDPAPGAVGPVRLGAVRLIEWTTDFERLADAADRPWKIDLGRSTRNALPAPPGTVWERTLRVPVDATLEVGYGVQGEIRHPVTFAVEAIESGRTALPLFSDTVRPPPHSPDTWAAASVDLSRLDGREVTIRLMTSGRWRDRHTRGLPVWSNPEIVSPSAADDRPNVVLIVLDTLRADRLSCYGHPRTTSPRIDRWAAESAVRFANAVAPSPWTLPSHASLFTGLDALRHGFNFWGTAPASLEMGAEILRRHGYTTAAITGGGVLRPRFGFAQGFDTFDYWGEPDSEHELDWVFDRAGEWLADHRNRRFFLFVHTYEVHAPHRRRQPFFDELASESGIVPAAFDLEPRTRPWEGPVTPGDEFAIRRPGSAGWTTELDADELATIGLMYDSAVAAVDARVGELLDRLTELGLRGRTLVIVTSDHGEALGENGRAGHSYLEDYNLLVPLIIELPDGTGAGAVIDRQVRLIDVMPTILGVVGADPLDTADGRSLVPLAAGDTDEHPPRAWAYAASSNRGLAQRIENRLKYVFPDPAWRGFADSEALFDLAADPGEQRNLAPADPRTGALRAEAEQTILHRHRGLRLTIRNSSDGILGGRLTGGWAARNRVKSARLADRALRWRDDRAVFQLEPGDETLLLLAPLRSPVAGLEVELIARGCGRLTGQFTDLDLTRLELPLAIRPTGRSWELVEVFDGELGTGLLLSRTDGQLPLVASGAPVDAGVADQLRALGYVE